MGSCDITASDTEPEHCMSVTSASIWSEITTSSVSTATGSTPPKSGLCASRVSMVCFFVLAFAYSNNNNNNQSSSVKSRIADQCCHRLNRNSSFLSWVGSNVLAGNSIDFQISFIWHSVSLHWPRNCSCQLACKFVERFTQSARV